MKALIIIIIIYYEGEGGGSIHKRVRKEARKELCTKEKRQSDARMTPNRAMNLVNRIAILFQKL